MPALITDVGFATNPSTTLTACSFTAPQTNTVRNGTLTSPINLIGLWRNGASKGQVQVTSPRIVPVSTGINYYAPAGCTGELLDSQPYQALTPQDILSVYTKGGASETDQVALQSYYQTLPGISMTLKNPGDIIGQTAFTFTWPVACTASATIGTLANTVITNTVDSSTANTWYALLGYTVDALVTAVGLVGVDTSQTYVAGPGLADVWKTRHYFMDLSTRSGMPCIPLFNSANKASTNIGVVDVAASTAVNVTMVLAQLNPGYQP